MRRLQRLSAVLVVAIGPVAALCQDPTPVPVPQPPVPRVQAPAPTPKPPRPPRTARAPRAARQDAGPDAFTRLQNAVRFENLIDGAMEATGLSRDEITPAVTALRALFVPEAGTIQVTTPNATIVHKTLSKDGHETMIIRNAPGAIPDNSRVESAEAGLANAIQALPEGKRDAFAEWATRKRVQIAELASAIAGDAAIAQGRADEEAREALESLARAERDLAAARERLDANNMRGRWPAEQNLRPLLEAEKSLEAYQQAMAEQLARMGRQRIETTLDKSLIDRYGALATDFDREATRRTIENILRGTADLMGETRPGVESMERRVAELHAQRRAIDAALEQATTELVRERAMKLEQEAQKRQAEQAGAEALRRQRRNAPDLPPEAPRVTQPEPGQSEAYQAEIRRLREELQNLRKEVEALRKAKEPKEPK